jgi:hypothetical protein
MPDMQFVNSSNVDQIGYDADRMELHVLFQNGDLYVYSDVPESIFEEFRAAPSVGSYLNREIKNVYNYSKQ